ncbi:MAG: hypothetical protein ACHQHO_11350 [Solirubrobacterales bacterium]
MDDSIERLSFELTTRTLAEQERTLSSMRSTAGTVLGAASIAGSFLGARIGGHPPDLWAVLATIAFVLCSGCAIWVLIPRDLVLSFGGEGLIAESDDRHSVEVAEGYRAACGWIEPRLDRNRRVLDGLADWLTRGCLLLAVEVVLQTISIID